MPRRPRTDAPGVVHHVFVRGLERRDLFLDDDDRHAFLGQLSRVMAEEGASGLAWALLPDHGHLLVRTGHAPLARVMQRVGTAYARRFNDRYGREGYLFQGRYGARPVGDDGDLLGLIRYVHRNPLEAGLVGSTEALAHHPWAGHAALMGEAAAPRFQSVEETLALFGTPPEVGRARLAAWMRAPEAAAPAPRAPLDGLDAVIASVCIELGVDEQALRGGRRRRPEVLARTLIALRARAELGLPAPAIARALGLSRQSLWARLGESSQRRARET
jgi:putative transposase